MSLKWSEAIVVGRRVWDEGLFTLTLDAPGVPPFEAGQFLQLGLRDGEHHVHRPYSVASPHGPTLEFFIVLVPDGELTPRLWRLRVGDRLEVGHPAAGRFTLSRAPAARDLWMIGTGTGVAPYVAMLRTEEPWRKYERIALVHGVRTRSDLAYRDEFEELQRSHPERFVYLPTTSRDDEPGGLSGRVTTLLSSGELEERAAMRLVPEQCAVLLCGNPAMLDDMERDLESRGLKRHRTHTPGQIVVERYW